MSSLSNPPWLQFRPFTPITKLRTYVQLPAFDVAVDWLGYSELVYQYNFSASQSFYLKNRPAKPLGVNYLLCIKYRVGETVYRYKLWGDVGEVEMDEVPLYTNQLILPNFVLEIWSTEDQTDAVQETAINLITSVVEMPTTISDLDDVALAVGASFEDYEQTAEAETPTSNFYWAPADLTTANWPGSAEASQTTPDLTWGTNPRTIGTNQGNQFVTDPRVNADVLVATPALNNRFSFWFAFYPTTWSAGDVILKLADSTIDYYIQLMAGTTAGSYIVRHRYLGVNTDTAEVTEFSLVAPDVLLVVNIRCNTAGQLSLAINAGLEVELSGLSIPIGQGFDRLSVVPTGHVGSYNVQEMRMLRNNSQGNIPYDSANVSIPGYWAYFFQQYGKPGGALTFDAGTYWLDNDPVELPS